jgi:hypothetical protein
VDFFFANSLCVLKFSLSYNFSCFELLCIKCGVWKFHTTICKTGVRLNNSCARETINLVPLKFWIKVVSNSLVCLVALSQIYVNNLQCFLWSNSGIRADDFMESSTTPSIKSLYNKDGQTMYRFENNNGKCMDEKEAFFWMKTRQWIEWLALEEEICCLSSMRMQVSY